MQTNATCSHVALNAARGCLGSKPYASNMAANQHRERVGEALKHIILAYDMQQHREALKPAIFVLISPALIPSFSSISFNALALFSRLSAIILGDELPQVLFGDTILNHLASFCVRLPQIFEYTDYTLPRIVIASLITNLSHKSFDRLLRNHDLVFPFLKSYRI